MGAQLETVTVQHERAKAPQSVRISRAVKRAIEMMVHDGLKRQEAALKAGLQDNSLYIAMRKPEVLAYLNAQQRVLRTSAAARSIARVDQLADDSTSDHVKLQANVFLLGIEGISPVQRTENTTNLNVRVPGLEVMFADRTLIHDQSADRGLSNVNNDMHVSVPHPSLRNVVDATYEEVPATPLGAGQAGEKS